MQSVFMGVCEERVADVMYLAKKKKKKPDLLRFNFIEVNKSSRTWKMVTIPNYVKEPKMFLCRWPEQNVAFQVSQQGLVVLFCYQRLLHHHLE